MNIPNTTISDCVKTGNFDHLDHDQLMVAMRALCTEAVGLIELANDSLGKLVEHNNSVEAHAPLRMAINELESKINTDIEFHNSHEDSHPELLNKVIEVQQSINEFKNKVPSMIDTDILTHNTSPKAHADLMKGIDEAIRTTMEDHNKDADANPAAISKHNTNPEAHRELLDDIREFIENHNEDPNAHENLLSTIAEIELFRYSRIGEVTSGHTMGKNNFIPADGRIIDLTLYPEMLAKINAGHLFYHASYVATHPGIWSRHSGNIFRAPNLSGRFPRYQLHNPGYWEGDAMQHIWGVAPFCPDDHTDMRLFGACVADRTMGGIRENDGGGNWYDWRIKIDSSAVTRVAGETRPVNSYTYPVIYLGRRA